MKKYDLQHVLSEILGIAVLMFPIGLVSVAVVSLVYWTGGENMRLYASWTALVTMGLVAVTLRFACGLDSRVVSNRCLTLAGVRLTAQKKTAIKEHRRHPRYAVGLPGTFSNERTSGFVQLANLSAEGCKMKAHIHLALDDCGQLLIEMPGCAGPVKVPRASVRWVKGNECGLEFSGINLAEQGWLKRLAYQMDMGTGGGRSRLSS